MRLGTKAFLLVIGLLCFGLASAQRGVDMSVEEAESLFAELPFTEAHIELRYELVGGGGGSGVVAFGWRDILNTIKDVLDTISEVINDVIEILGKIFGSGNTIGGGITYTPSPIVEQRGRVQVGSTDSIWLEHNGRGSLREVMEGLESLEAHYERGFLVVRFSPDARVRVVTMNFRTDAPLSDSLKESLGLRGNKVVPRGVYTAEGGFLRIPVK